MSFDPHKANAVALLVGFVITAVAARATTRYIRWREHRRREHPRNRASIAERSIIKNMHIGGVHIHHQVWGILLVLVVGLIVVIYQPQGIAMLILALLFGAGAALALDEFAMWLYLKDVYWQSEGRKSISAMEIALAICLILAVGSDPLDLTTAGFNLTGFALAPIVIVNMVFIVISILKGKVTSALVGVIVPVFSVVAAIRLAKPNSWWARRNYSNGSSKLERSQKRFGAAYVKRWRRIQDLLGGKPDSR